MSKVASFVLPFAVLGCLSGCGGSGGSGSNAYQGTYVGEFDDSSDITGPVEVTVSSSGAVNGSYTYNAGPVAFEGSINGAGKGSVTDVDGTYPITFGNFVTSTVAAGVGTSVKGAYVTLIKNPTGSFGGVNQFTGQYAGTIDNTTVGKTGIVAMNIDSSGNVTGVDLYDINGTPTLTKITGTLTNAGTINYTIAANGVAVTGTNLALANGTITGSLTESNGDSATISISQVLPPG